MFRADAGHPDPRVEVPFNAAVPSVYTILRLAPSLISLVKNMILNNFGAGHSHFRRNPGSGGPSCSLTILHGGLQKGSVVKFNNRPRNSKRRLKTERSYDSQKRAFRKRAFPATGLVIFPYHWSAIRKRSPENKKYESPEKSLPSRAGLNLAFHFMSTEAPPGNFRDKTLIYRNNQWAGACIESPSRTLGGWRNCRV